MKNKTFGISLRQAAIVAGLGLLIITVLAPFAEFTRQSLVVSGDMMVTTNNILENGQKFRLVILSFLIIAILDLMVAWALYIFLKPVNKSISLLGGWFRMIYAAILAIVLTNLMNVLSVLNNINQLSILRTEQLNAQIEQLLDAFDFCWLIGLVFFSLHLLVIGYLVLRSNYIPQIIGYLLLITPIGYLVDSFGKILSSSYDANYAMFTFIGEPLFMGWLLYRGIKGQIDENK